MPGRAQRLSADNRVRARFPRSALSIFRWLSGVDCGWRSPEFSLAAVMFIVALGPWNPDTAQRSGWGFSGV